MPTMTIVFLTEARDRSSMATLPDGSDTCSIALDLVESHLPYWAGAVRVLVHATCQTLACCSQDSLLTNLQCAEDFC